MMTRMLSVSGALMGALICAGCSDQGLVGPSAPASPASRVAAVQDGGPEYANVSNQGGAGLYAVNGASIVRQPDGLQARLSMPTPEPGTYSYPAGTAPGHPEVFTLWIFVFNNPELCTMPCGPDDLGVDKPARGGAYNGGGHVVSGNTLSIAGRIGVGETPFDHPTITMAPLESPATATVHLAIAAAWEPGSIQAAGRIPASHRHSGVLVGRNVPLNRGAEVVTRAVGGLGEFSRRSRALPSPLSTASSRRGARSARRAHGAAWRQPLPVRSRGGPADRTSAAEFVFANYMTRPPLGRLTMRQ